MNATNIETYLLLYIDNELSAQEKEAVECFLQENPIYQKELALLQQTVLEPEAIEYEDKALLYRHDEMEAILSKDFKQSLYKKEAAIVKGYFINKRLLSLSAVAAILLLIVGYLFLNNTHDNINVASTALELKAPNLNNQRTAIGKENVKATAHYESKINTVQPYRKAPSTLTEKPTTEIISSPKEMFASTAKEAQLNTIATNETEEMNHINLTPSSLNIVNNSKPTETAESITTPDTEEHDRGIYIANFEIDGDKLRGITRRVNAFLRRNKSDKEK